MKNILLSKYQRILDKLLPVFRTKVHLITILNIAVSTVFHMCIITLQNKNCTYFCAVDI